MQLPFSIVVEPPTRAELRQIGRYWWVGAIVLGLALLGYAAVFLAAPLLWDQPRALATLDVRSQPYGAEVEIDGRQNGLTPAHLGLPPGPHQIILRRIGYAEASYDISLDAGHPTSLQTDLWPQAPATLELRPPFPGATIAGANFLSDGRVALTIILGSARERQAWLVDGRGESERLGPTGGADALAVSPDAGRVAYLAPAKGPVGDSTQPPTIWIADPAGGHPRRLVPSTSSDVRFDDLSWATDGQHLLAVGHVPRPEGGQSSLLLWVDSTDGASRELARIPSEVVPESYRWSPDRGQVAFLTRADQLTSLCLIGVRDGNFHYLADLGRGSAPTYPFAPVAWSADGRQVAYTAVPVTRAASVGWPFAVSPSGQLVVAEADQLPGRVLSPTATIPLAWDTDGQSEAVVALGQARRNGPLFLHSLSPKGTDRALVEVAVSPSGHFVARWDAAHRQALAAVADGTSLGTPRWSYWLIRFGESAS